MPLTARDFDGVIRKLQMEERVGGHRFVFFVHNGKKILSTCRSHGRGDLGRVEHTIRKQLQVNRQQMTDLVNCPMTRNLYIEHLIERKLIDPE